MTKGIVCLLVFMLSVNLVSAGELYGTIKEGNRPVCGGIKVMVQYGKKSVTALTDKYGSYSVRVPGSGKCRLYVYFKGANPSMEVYSYERSIRYDLTIENAGGNYSLRRNNGR